MMPVRHWLVAAAGVALATLGYGSAWAHSGVGSQQSTASTVTRDVGTSLTGVLSGRLDQVTGGVGTGFNNTAMTTHLTGSESGRSGASSLKDSALWANFGYTSLKNDNTFTAYDGHVVTGMVGFDARPIDELTLGVAFGYENLDIDTTFNQGTQKWDGYTISPYAVYRFTRNYSIDGTVAYSWLNTDITRLSNTVRGSYDSNRWMAATNVNGNWEVDKWRLGATIGYLVLRQDDNPYNETGTGAGSVAGLATRIGQGKAGVRVGYSFGMVEPYAKARVEHEFKSSNSQVVAPGVGVSPDRTGVVLGAGALFNFNSRWSGAIEGTTTQARDNQDIWGVSGTVRFRF